MVEQKGILAATNFSEITALCWFVLYTVYREKICETKFSYTDKRNSLKLSQMNNLNAQMIVKRGILAATTFSEITALCWFFLCRVYREKNVNRTPPTRISGIRSNVHRWTTLMCRWSYRKNLAATNLSEITTLCWIFLYRVYREKMVKRTPPTRISGIRLSV